MSNGQDTLQFDAQGFTKPMPHPSDPEYLIVYHKDDDKSHFLFKLERSLIMFCFISKIKIEFENSLWKHCGKSSIPNCICSTRDKMSTI